MTSRLTMAIPLTEKRSWTLLIRQCLTGCVSVAVVTLVGYRLRVLPATAGFIYLLVVMLASLAYGLWPATFISLVAVSCLNYFLIPPVLSFSVSDPRDWIALISFQVCALLVSRRAKKDRSDGLQGRAPLSLRNSEVIFIN